MRFESFSFGSICIHRTTYAYDVVIDSGRIRKHKKKPSKRFRDTFGHAPLSIPVFLAPNPRPAILNHLFVHPLDRRLLSSPRWRIARRSY